jgi:hypothetical protein
MSGKKSKRDKGGITPPQTPSPGGNALGWLHLVEFANIL